jgi:hypothetical protein
VLQRERLLAVRLLGNAQFRQVLLWMDGKAAAEKLIWRCQSADPNASEEEDPAFSEDQRGRTAAEISTRTQSSEQ